MRIVLKVLFAVSLCVCASQSWAAWAEAINFKPLRRDTAVYALNTENYPAWLTNTEFKAKSEIAAKYWTDIAGSSINFAIGGFVGGACEAYAGPMICWVPDIKKACNQTVNVNGCATVVYVNGVMYYRILLSKEFLTSEYLQYSLSHNNGHLVGLDHGNGFSVMATLVITGQPQLDDIAGARALHAEPVVEMSTAGDVHVPCVVHGQGTYQADISLVRNAVGVATHFVVRDARLRAPSSAMEECAKFIFEQDGDRVYNVNVREPNGKVNEYRTRLILTSLTLVIDEIIEVK